MKVSYQFILFSVLVASAVGSLAPGRYNSTVTSAVAKYSDGFFNSPEHPGKCVIDDLILSSGDEVQDPYSVCGIVSCGLGGWAVFAGCEIARLGGGYTIGERKYPGADYPKCCEREIVFVGN